MKRSVMILLLGAAVAFAEDFQFIFENRPEHGLPRDAEAQQRSNRPATNTPLRTLIGETNVIVQVRYFDSTWISQEQVGQYLAGLLQDPAVPAGSHYFWSQGLAEPEIECHLTLQNYRRCKLLLWETAGAFQEADGTWWFLNTYDYYHRAHPYGTKSPAGRNRGFAKQAIDRLASGLPRLVPMPRTERSAPVTEYRNSVTGYFCLTNGAGMPATPRIPDLVVQVDSFASPDQSKRGLERSIRSRPMHYTGKKSVEDTEVYQWSNDVLAGAVGPYVLNVHGTPGASSAIMEAFAALARELKSRTEDPGVDETDAVRIALRALADSRTDLSQHELAAPESAQRVALESGNAWRISWRHKTPPGAAAIKGGQIVVLLHDSGRLQIMPGE